jgi:hypothetical protein
MDVDYFILNPNNTLEQIKEKILSENYFLNSVNYFQKIMIFKSLIELGNLELFIFFFDKIYDDTEFTNNIIISSLQTLCSTKITKYDELFEICEYLINKLTADDLNKEIDDNTFNNYEIKFNLPSHLFLNACLNSDIKIVKYLYGHAKEYLIKNLTHQYAHKLFEFTCFKGNFETVKWLYNTFNIDIHYNNDIAFLSACLSGNINLSKWIHNFGDVNINVIELWNDNFLMICLYGFVDIIKWLHSIGNFVIDTNNITFQYFVSEIYNENNIDMAMWINSICPEVIFIIENNTIKKFFIKNQYSELLCEYDTENYRKIICLFNNEI